MILHIYCSTCHKPQPSFEVVDDDYADWYNGKLIHQAMPYLTADQRELLLSQTCSSCWNDLFSSSGDDEEENETVV